MAKIPSGDRIGRDVASGVTSVARLDTSMVGVGLDRLSAAINQNLDSRSRYQYSQAASEFLIAKTKQDSAYDNDQDYGSIEQRYTDGVGSALANSAELIQDRVVREEFLQKFRVSAAEGTSRIKEIAFGKERDYQRGYVGQQLRSVADAGMSGNVEEALAVGQALLLSSRDQGYLSAQEYAQQTQEFRQSTKLRYLDMMKPQERLSALRGPLAGDIPADVHAKMVSMAETELLDGVVAGNVDAALAETRRGKTPTEVIQGFAGIKDDAERRATEDRFQQQWGRVKSAESDEAVSLVSKYVLDLRLGNTSFDRIATTPDGAADLARIAELSPNALAALQAAERGPDPASAEQNGRDAWYLLTSMAKKIQTGEGPYDATKYPNAKVEYQDTFAQLHPYLSTADYKQLAQVNLEASIPPPVQSWLTTQQRFDDSITQVLAATGVSGEAGASAVRASERAALDSWVQALGRDPTPTETQKYLDEMTLRRLGVSVDKEGMFSGADPWAATTAEQRDAALNKIRTGDPEGMRKVLARLQGGTGKVEDLDAELVRLRAGISVDRLRVEYELQKRGVGGR